MKKSLQNDWLRESALFFEAHAKLEKELQRMREKKVRQEFIDQKDQMIESLVSFYNSTDELIQYYKQALLNSRMENHFLTEMLSKKISISELVEYKPSAKVEIVNMENGDSKTLSKLNG